MLYSVPQLLDFAANLSTEIKLSNQGKKTNLAFAVNKLPYKNQVKDGEVFQVMMMGGSHLESSLVKIVDGNVEILSFFDDELPTLVSREVVLEVFAKNFDPNVKFVALNFAYPLKPVYRDDLLDGELLTGTKEHTFKGLVGKNVGEEIEKYLEFVKQKKVKVSVCNDTVALGLASLNYKPGFDYSNTIFGVVGTGFNFGTFKNNVEQVNLESGNFARFEQSYTGKILDALSSNYEKQKLEKEVGGAYLINHFNILSNLEGYGVNLKTTKEMSVYAENHKDGVSELILQVFQRAASLVAMHIYALYLWKQELAQAGSDFCLLAMIEGSLFLKGYKFREFVENYLHDFGLNTSKYQIDHFDHMGIYGASKLAVHLKTS